MSEDDQQPECTRQRRSLSRALIVAGATVVGTSAVWLAGVAASADAATDSQQVGDPARVVVDHPAPAEPLADGTGGPIDLPKLRADPAAPLGAQTPAPSDPAVFRLSDLDQAELLAEPARPHRDHAEANPPDSRTDPVGDALRQSGEEPPPALWQAMTTTVGNDAQTEHLSAARSGPGDPGTPPRRAATTAPETSGAFPGVVDPPHVDDTPNLRPAPAASAAQNSSAVPVTAQDRAPHRACEHTHERGAHIAPRATAAACSTGSHLGSDVPDETAGEWSTDWSDSTAVLPGRPHGTERSEAAGRAGAAHDLNVPTGNFEDQPGTTPD